MSCSDEKVVKVHQRGYSVTCRDSAPCGEKCEPTSETPFVGSRLEITEDGMVHVIVRTDRAWACFVSLPLVFVTLVSIWENLPSPWNWLGYVSFLWVPVFCAIFYKFKHYMIDPKQTRACYVDSGRTLSLELPNGRWLGVAPSGKVREAFFKAMKEIYGDRMLETMENQG